MRERATSLGRCALVALVVACGCAKTGSLKSVTQAVTPPSADSLVKAHRELRAVEPFAALFSDTTIGFVPGTGDSTRRYLGRLRDGFTVDTLNIILLGDNRPGYRTTRLYPEAQRIK